MVGFRKKKIDGRVQGFLGFQTSIFLKGSGLCRFFAQILVERSLIVPQQRRMPTWHTVHLGRNFRTILQMELALLYL